MGDVRTLFSLSLRDEASKQLKTFERNYKQTIDDTVSADGGDGQQFAQLATNVTSVEGALTMLGATAPQVALAMAGLNAASTAVDWARQAATVDELEASYDRLAGKVGVSGMSMLTSMRSASAGMISDMDLMLAANAAMSLGVVDTVDEMTSLLQVAIAKGAEFGRAPTQAFGDLINGLGRMSPEILNNIGIIVNANQAYAAYAATIGTTADKLNQQQKMQALVNAVLAANPNAAAEAAAAGESAAASFQRWDVATKQFSETWGRVFLPQIAAGLDLVTRFVNAVGGLGNALSGKLNLGPEQIDAKIAEQRALIADYKNPQKYFPSDTVNSSIAQAEEQIRMLEQAKAMLASTANVAATSVNNVGVAATNAAAGERQAQTESSALMSRLAELSAQANATQSALRSMWIGAAGALGADAALAGLQSQQKELDILTQEWNYAGLTGEQMEFQKAEWLDKNNAKLQTQIRLLDGVGAAAGGAASNVDSLQSSIGSKVGGVISESMNLGVDWPGKDQQGGDAINENAKRLAAIANEGLKGQSWMDEFKNEAPGTYADLMLKIAEGMNPQAAAQQLMSEFQAGLRPELLDKDMIKERVKQMLLGDANTAALAQEIATELASEMGVSMPTALAAAKSALGVPTAGQTDDGTGADATAQGNSAGGAFMAGFVATASGGAIATTITSQITAALALFDTSGRSAAGKWVAGFYAVAETNLAPQLVALLATLVTPIVQANLAAQQSQTSTQDKP